jgi:hypothetical protein
MFGTIFRLQRNHLQTRISDEIKPVQDLETLKKVERVENYVQL